MIGHRVEIISIFLELFDRFLTSSLVCKAIDRAILSINIVDLRKFAEPPQYHVDDTPYGGGPGMVMMAAPLIRAVEDCKIRLPNSRVLLMTPSGKCFSQNSAVQFSKEQELIIICGRYEGIDQRVIDLTVDEEISIGDYVLMGGELPAMVVVEATVRHITGVIGNEESLRTESFSLEQDGSQLLEAPQFTKPSEFYGLKVPAVLLSGNHKKIAEWRKEEALKLTQQHRPDLIGKRGTN